MNTVSTSPRRRIPRPSIALLAVTTLAVTAACGGGSGSDNDVNKRAQDQAELTFWSWVPGIDKAVDRWNAEHPDTKVKLRNIPAGPQGGYAKMFAAVKAGNAPDLAQIEADRLASFLLADGLEDITNHVKDDRAKFVPWQWNQTVFGGRSYAVPQDSGPMALFYRKDLFDRWGIRPPATWKEFEKAARTIREKEGDSYIASFGPDASGSAWLAGLSWQAGARWFGVEGDAWKVGIDDAPSRRVFDYWGGLARSDLVRIEPTFSQSWYAHLQDGTVAAWPAPYWGDTILRAQAPKTAGNWRVAPLPRWDSTTASGSQGGSTTAVMKGSENAEAAAEFAVWLNSAPDALALIAPNVGWPAAKDAASLPGVTRDPAFYGGQRIEEVFARMDQAVDKGWKWGPTTDGLYRRMQDGLTEALADKAPLSPVLRDSHRATVEDLRSKGIEVAP